MLDRLRERLNEVLIGKSDKIELVLACLLAQGHLLLDDLPVLARRHWPRPWPSHSALSSPRIQCTPDLLPTDVTGF